MIDAAMQPTIKPASYFRQGWFSAEIFISSVSSRAATHLYGVFQAALIDIFKLTMNQMMRCQ